MLVTRRMHLEVELMKWVVVLFMALVLAWIVAVQTAGGDELPPAKEPLRFPPDMAEIAKALAEPPGVLPFFPEQGPRVATVDPRLADDLWRLVRLQEKGQVEEAIAGWKVVLLPARGEIWRHVALAIGALQTGDLERAEAELEAARFLQARQPIVAYYTGILRLEMAGQTGALVPEMVTGLNFAARHQDHVPAVRGMYQLAALVEFRDVLAWAGDLQLAEPLVAEAGNEGPTVGEFLATVGARNYVGQTHNMLAYLYLDRGLLTDAEEQFDAAAATGIEIPFGYRDLGLAFEEREQNGNAARAYLKAMQQHGEGWVAPARKAWRNLTRWLEW